MSSLLSRERALRSTATTSERGDTNNQQSSSSIGFSTSSTANNTRTTEKKIFPALSEVDKTPVTSPENIETTK